MASAIYKTLRQHDKDRARAHVEKMRARNHLSIYDIIGRGDPLYPVRILGSKCKVHESDQHYHNTERELNLVKWNDREDTTIDRFDVRMTMDFIREPIPGRPPPPLSDELQHEEDQCNYERYRDLTRLVRKGHTEDEKGLEYVEKEEIERRVMVDGHNAPTAQAAKAAAAGAPQQPSAAAAATGAAAGTGQYANVGFSYGAGGEYANEYAAAAAAALAEAAEGGESDLSSDSDSYDSEEDDVDRKLAEIASEFGIADMGFHVREERRLKAAAEERQNRPRGPSRKQIKRMRRRIYEANRNGHPALDENKLAEMERERAEARRRRSPTMGYANFRGGEPSPSYEPYRGRGEWSPSRLRDRSPSPKRAVKEYITEFTVEAANEYDASPRASPRRHVQPPPRPSLPAAGPKAPAGIYKPGLGPPPGKAGAAAAAGAGAGAKKETPQERVKRLMQSQLNRTIAKDAEKEAAKLRERLQERAYVHQTREDAGRSTGDASQGRYGRERSRSRSRSRERSRERRQSHGERGRYGGDRERERERDRGRGRSRSRSRDRDRRSRSRSRGRGAPHRRSRCYQSCLGHNGGRHTSPPRSTL